MIKEIEEFMNKIKTTLYKNVVLKVKTEFVCCSNINCKIEKNIGETIDVIKKEYPDGREYWYAVTNHEGKWHYNCKVKTRYGVWYNNKVKITEEEINTIIT